MAVPVEWLGNFQVNTGPAATGIQTDPRTIGLSSGNILVAWIEEEDGAISDGDDANIVGRLYSPEGRPLGAAFVLDGDDDDALAFDIAATNDGGFYLVHTTYFNNGDVDIYGVSRTRFNAGGARGAGSASGSTSQIFSNPTVTVDQFTNTALIAYSVYSSDDQDTDVEGYLLADDGAESSTLSLGQNSPNTDDSPDVATLSNGNFVVVYEEVDPGQIGIEFSIVAPDGSVANIPAEADGAVNPRVAALAGGGFVIAYDSPFDNGDIAFRIYDDEGTAGATFSVGFGPDLQKDTAVVALHDGGFLVTWLNASDSTLEGFRLLANGNSNGGPFIIATDVANQPEIGLTGDGRLLFTWRNTFNLEIRSSIWDPRDFEINAIDYFGGPNFVNGSIITGHVGSAIINGNDLDVELRGQAANDTITGGFGGQTLLGGGGDDSILGGDSAAPTSSSGDHLDGGAGKDTIIAALGDDTLIGGAGADSLRANSGDDTLTGGLGQDALNGGRGADWASYAQAAAKVRADLAAPGGNTGEAAGDSYVKIENLFGSRFNDALRGDGLANRLDGAKGDDKLTGRAGDDLLVGRDGVDVLTGGDGDDTLVGGVGADVLKGNAGADEFRIDTLVNGNAGDRIADFAGGLDTIALSADVFGLPEGALNPARFVVAGQAQDANDRLVYNSATGRLFFDPDGSGAQAQQLLATLAGAPTLAASDFTVI